MQCDSGCRVNDEESTYLELGKDTLLGVSDQKIMSGQNCSCNVSSRYLKSWQRSCLDLSYK